MSNSTFTDIVAAKKLATIKKSYKLAASTEDKEENSPETKKKLEKKIEKDYEKQQKQTLKREEAHQERERQREKLRSRVRAKYDLGDEQQQRIGKEKNKKKGDIKEKDFYKYNKAMPEEQGKKVDKKGKTLTLTEKTEQLSGQKNKKGDCLVS